MFASTGKFKYFESVKAHIARRVNQLVDYYIALGEYESRIAADKFADSFHKQYGIGQTFERISANIPTIIDSFKEWVIATYSSQMPGLETFLYRDSDYYYLKSSSKIYNDWLEQAASRSYSIALGKKKNDIFPPFQLNPTFRV